MFDVLSKCCRHPAKVSDIKYIFLCISALTNNVCICKQIDARNAVATVQNVDLPSFTSADGARNDAVPSPSLPSLSDDDETDFSDEDDDINIGDENLPDNSNVGT